MLGFVIGIAVLVVVLVAAKLWMRRFDREVEIPTRELTPEEKQAQVVRGAAAGTIIGGIGGGPGI